MTEQHAITGSPLSVLAPTVGAMTEFTVELPTALLDALDRLVDEGLASDRDAFVERAIRRLLEEQRNAAEPPREPPR